MAYSLYLIRNTRDTDLYYAEHGEIGGVPDAVGASHFTWLGCGITAMLRSGKPIPDRLLAPTPGRLRLWRC